MYKNDAEQDVLDPHKSGCATVSSVQRFLVIKRKKKKKTDVSIPIVKVLRGMRMLRFMSTLFSVVLVRRGMLTLVG